MKAVVYDRRNSTETLMLREVEKPIPKDNEVLVRVAAASVNAADYRSMKLRIIPKRRIFGADIAGCIEAVGKDVKKFKVGDEVMGDIASCGFGGFAEFVAVPEKLLILKPMKIPYKTAAAIPMAGVTALQALRDQGSICPGKKVLIYGAGGGVGTFAVQLAKYYDADVTAVCGEKNVEIMQSLGADQVINYGTVNFAAIGKQYDLIIAVNGNHSLVAYKRLLAPKGIFVLVGGAMSQVMRTLLFKSFLSMGNKKMRLLMAKTNSEDLEFVVKLMEGGRITPVIDRVYSLHETSKAVRYLREGHAGGKVVINIRDFDENPIK